MSEFIHSDSIILILITLTIISIIGLFIMIGKTNSLNKKYKKFMKKLGNGESIEEDLENYMYRVERVENQNAEILGNIKAIEYNMDGCFQKIGMVRYSAYKDNGSDLSFAIALLDNNNNGIILNGIYSRELSNIFAKPIEKGSCKYTLTDEEKQALEKAKGKNVSE